MASRNKENSGRILNEKDWIYVLFIVDEVMLGSQIWQNSSEKEMHNSLPQPEENEQILIVETLPLTGGNWNPNKLLL